MGQRPSSTSPKTSEVSIAPSSTANADAAKPRSFLITNPGGMDDSSDRPRKGFSTSFRQRHNNVGAFAEGLHAKDETSKKVLDRRTRVKLHEERYAASSFIQIQIEGKVHEDDEGSFVGTASGIYRTRDGRKYTITCAHNVVMVDEENDELITSLVGLTAYDGRQGIDVYKAKYPVTEVYVHPLYNGSPKCGFDIAVCVLGQQIASSKYDQDHFTFEDVEHFKFDDGWKAVDPAEVEEQGIMVEIVGYPGEKDSDVYQHQASTAGILKTKLGGYILKHHVDTTPGNSGSSIMVVDAAWLQRVGARMSKATVAVHTGSDQVNRVNYGTLITKELSTWIHSCLG